MRRISAQIQALRPASFVLLIGLVAGTAQGVPQLLLGGATSVGLHLIPLLVIGGLAVLTWTAAFLLWWIAVHRRQSTVWMIAAQVTLGLVLGDLVHAALAAVSAGVETHGQFTAALLREPWAFIASNLQFSLLRSPVWFVGSLVAIAMGRRLSSSEQTHTTAASPTPGEGVT